MTDQKPDSISKLEKPVHYVPLGETTGIQLTINTVRKFLAVKTRSGKTPTDEDIVKFMMLCQARELNPWTGDAFLVGYDAHDGPVFSLITGVSALHKRAECNAQYDGIESGVIVKHETDGKPSLEFRDGTITFEGENLVGGWAKVYRKDRSKPFAVTVKFATYDTGRSRWKADPGGMIVKVAEAAALRKAFPTTAGGLYVAEEMAQANTEDRTQKTLALPPPRPQDVTLDDLTAGTVETPEDPRTSPERPQEAPSGELSEEQMAEAMKALRDCRHINQLPQVLQMVADGASDGQYHELHEYAGIREEEIRAEKGLNQAAEADEAAANSGELFS